MLCSKHFFYEFVFRKTNDIVFALRICNNFLFKENNTTCTFIVYAFQGLSKITEDGVHSCVVGTWKQLHLHRFREKH